MGWYYQHTSRKQLVAELTRDRISEAETVQTRCLKSCYRGNPFSGVLWTVWERTFPDRHIERWIGCDLLRYDRQSGWGHKPMEEACGPYYYSCPLGYLQLVPIEVYGGNEGWRVGVQSYHDRQAEKRQQKREAQAQTV